MDIELDTNNPEQTPEAFTQFIGAVTEALRKGGFSQNQMLAALSLMGSTQKEYGRMLLAVVAWHEGKNLDQIGDMLGLTRERARQILAKATNIGVRDANWAGGASRFALVRKQAMRVEKSRRLETKAQKRFGCSLDELYSLNDGISPWSQQRGNRARIFFLQKRAMLLNGVEWKLTFPEWCKVWDDSTMWSNRGRGKGKVTLARIDSTKPFEVGNVAIRRNAEIASEAGAKSGAIKRQQIDDGNPLISLDVMAKQEEARRLRDEEGLGHREIANRLGLRNSQTAATYACAARKRHIGKSTFAPPAYKKASPASPFPSNSLGAKLTSG